jgi:putative endonuclease
MMSFYFYVLRSKRDGSFYKGQAGDVDERLRRHNQGDSRPTKNRRPWKLVYTEEYDTRSEAVRREQFLKSPKGWNEWKTLCEKIEGGLKHQI